MKKKLDFFEPEIRTYNHHAFPAGILSGRYKEEAWLYNNFSQLEFNPNSRRNIDYVFDYFFEKDRYFIKGYYMFPQRMQQTGEIIERIIDLIRTGSYIVGIYDEFYISTKPPFKKWHFEHNYIIHGFNKNEKVFYSSGYIGNDMKWKKYCITFKEFTDALVINDEGFIVFNNFIPMEGIEEKIDEKKIVNGIIEFLNYGKLQSSAKQYGVYGVKLFWNMIENKIRNEQHIHVPSVYCIYEHFGLMGKKVKWLRDNKKLDIEKDKLSEFNSLRDSYRMLLGLCDSYNLTLNPLIGQRIYRIGKKCLDTELRLLSDIMNLLM